MTTPPTPIPHDSRCAVHTKPFDAIDAEWCSCGAARPEDERLARKLCAAQAKALHWPHDGQWGNLVPALRAPYLAMARVAISEAVDTHAALVEALRKLLAELSLNAAVLQLRINEARVVLRADTVVYPAPSTGVR